MVTKSSAMNRASLFFILFGLGGFLYSVLSSALVITGISILSIIMGGFLAFRVRISPLFGRHSCITFILLGLFIVWLPACTVKVPINPDVGKIEIKQQLPIDAALLITEETKNYIFRGRPASLTMSARPHEFPLGEALEKASVQTFAQVFPKVTVVRSTHDARKFPIVVEPQIEQFHFEYDQLSYLGFAVSVVSRIRANVTLASGETKIWERSVQSPDFREGPWIVNFSYEEEVGKSAARSLIFALRNIAAEMISDESIRQFVEKQRGGP